MWSTQIARFVGPTWGPPGSCWTQIDPMLAPWTLLSGYSWPVFKNTHYGGTDRVDNYRNAHPISLSKTYIIYGNSMDIWWFIRCILQPTNSDSGVDLQVKYGSELINSLIQVILSYFYEQLCIDRSYFDPNRRYVLTALLNDCTYISQWSNNTRVCFVF